MARAKGSGSSKGSGSLAARKSLYARYEELGYKICPTCRDYVDPTVHDCESYQTIWPVTRSMDNFARAMRAK